MGLCVVVSEDEMINTLQQFGTNAGIVWNVLLQEKSLPIDRIVDKTHLRFYEVEIAIGWLARENKIHYEQGHYSLNQTNLTSQIGSNAGLIWHLIHEKGESSVQDLVEKSLLSTQEIYKAIGWLAREEKIQIKLQ